MYIHTGPNIYKTADGRLVEEGDPAAAFLVVATGGQLSDEDAARYGLDKASEKPAPGQNKAKAPPAQQKEGGLTITAEDAPASEPATPPIPPADDDAPARRRKH